MACKRNRFLADAFHQAAVAGKRIGVVLNQVGAELVGKLAFRHGHADSIADALAKRAGGGFDPGGVAIFRMAGGGRTQLAEILDVVERDVVVSEQVEQRIDQHRTVAGGQHKAVAVRPAGLLRIEGQIAGKQHRGDIGSAHRQAGMPGFGFLYSIHRQKPDCIRHPVVFFA
jgi:hypothetical protein